MESTFQHTAARRRLQAFKIGVIPLTIVSTHSRPKAAATWNCPFCVDVDVSTHSRPKAAASCTFGASILRMFQHTAARRRLLQRGCDNRKRQTFQHTAARRRLQNAVVYSVTIGTVSTHSRPKAAASYCKFSELVYLCFNTQPPEGGCRLLCIFGKQSKPFQHTAARRRLQIIYS